MIKSERSLNDQITLQYNLQSSFNLTSIINSQQPTPRSLSQTLIDFITQKINPSQDSLRSIKQDSQSPHQFTTYLNEIGGWLEQVKGRVSKKYNKDLVNYTGEQGITKCYSDIPYIFFDKQFALKMDNYGIPDKMKDQQEELIQYLDLIEINLYYQVNSKFSDFYEALSNFQDLEHRVEDNINRLLIVRREIPVIKRQFTEKAQKILKILQLKTNKQAVLRHLTIMRSLKKLPPTIKTILQSPLPHESLELLSTGKSMYSIVKRIQSMKSVGESLDKSDNIIKHSLQKSFSDKFFLYLMSPLNAPYGKNFEQLSLSSSQNKLDNSYILEFAQPHIFKQPQTPDRVLKTQQQLVLTIIQSCCFVDFVTGSRIKNKIIDHSKLVSKQFFQSLKLHIINYFQKASKQQKLINQNLNEALDKINIQNFDKVLQMYHKNYKISIKRLINILQTLYQKLQKQNQIQNSERFIDIAQQLFYLLSGLLKIVSDQTTTLYDLKKLSKQINIQEFKHYLVPLTKWIQYIQQILLSDLFRQKQQYVVGFEVQQYKNKIQILLQPLIQKKSKLQDAYITNFHMRIISNQIKSNLQKQTWVPVEDISYQYLTLFNYIFNKNYQSIQKSCNNSFNNSFVQQLKVMQIKQNITNNQTNNVSPQDIVDIKLFKNGIILNRKIYKTTISFLQFCQTFYKYLKIQEFFPAKYKEMVMRIGDISTYYSSYSTQLIVFAGALKFNLIKNKLITVKHLCLLWCNIRILVCMLNAQKHPQLDKIFVQVQNHSKQVIKKMSNIIFTKVQNELSSLIRGGLGSSVPTQHTANIINSQRQMIQITQQYLDEASIKEIMAQSINLMIKKFLQFVESKGQRGHLQGKYYFQSMKVLQILFEDQMQYMKKVLKL